jgi:hypothetical protein
MTYARSRSSEGAARSEEEAHHAERGSRPVGAEPAVGEEVDEAAAEGGRRRSHAPFAREGVESQDSAESAQKAVRIVRAEYGDFGPTLAAEYLGEQHAIRVGKETLRQWMIEDGIWKPKAAKVENVHVWRPRRNCLGELAQWDTSEHDWLEGRGEKLYLIVMLDDATSRGLARFVRHDSTEENMRLMRRYLERWGRSLGYYADRASLFQNTPKASHPKDAPELEPTQTGRALQELGIEPLSHRVLFICRKRSAGGLRPSPAKGIFLFGIDKKSKNQNQKTLQSEAVRYIIPSVSRKPPRVSGRKHGCAASLSSSTFTRLALDRASQSFLPANRRGT